MSRIFNLRNINPSILLHTNIRDLVTKEFFKEFNIKGVFYKNSYLYYDFFFYTLSLTFVKKNLFFLNFVLFKNFKNFLNYFYYSGLLGGNFIVVDNNYNMYSPFLHLFYSESFLIPYNSFFKKNNFFLKQPHSIILLKKFFKKKKTSTLIILNYDEFYKYLPMYSTFNASIVSFILPNMRSDFLDFFLFKSSSFFYLEKLVFLAKIYHIHCAASTLKSYKQYCYFKKLLDKFYFYLI